MYCSMTEIKKSVDSIFEETVEIRRKLHSHPELSEHEENTSRFICERLSQLGIEYEGNVAGYGVSAVIYGKDTDKAVGIRADMDALPIEEKTDVPFRSQNSGVMHACGHDIHTAILLGTAKILNEMREKLPYSVILLFQPSEETIGGARQMIEAGCLKTPEVRDGIGLHVEPELRSDSVQFIAGAMNAASCEFYVTVNGVSCHGAHPSLGLDPLIPACEMVTALQSVITRRLAPTDSAVITVGQLHSGTKNNIIPPETKFSGIIRALTNGNRQLLKEKLKEVCDGIAAAHGTTCSIEFCDSYPALVNDGALYRIMTEAAEEILGADRVKFRTVPSLGADDFSYFCQEDKGLRGLYYNVGSAKDDRTPSPPIHSDVFCPDEESIRTGMLTEIYGVLKIMEAYERDGI